MKTCSDCRHFIADNDRWASCHRDPPRKMSDGSERYPFVMFFESCGLFESGMALEPPIDVDGLLKDLKL